jgi:5-methylcytosine-specific restriction endonuclease McrA
VIRNKAINARKNHARRTVGPPALSVHQIAERDGNRCHICSRKVNMTWSGMAKWGPTIEHILPVSQGGTNEPGNLALAHRHCNTARGNRGHSQLLLVA